MDFAALLESRAAQLAAESPDLAERIVAWLAHLASFEPDGALPMGTQVRQYETAYTLSQTYGAEAVSAGILLACRLAETKLSTPEAFLARVVKSAVERAKRGQDSGRTRRQGQGQVNLPAVAPVADANGEAVLDLDAYDIDPLADI